MISILFPKSVLIPRGRAGIVRGEYKKLVSARGVVLFLENYFTNFLVS